ncbi:MAG TPA: NAD(P)-binding domain-containing protein [Bryobacteraceae bacterium]|nr:NAD(P)-binding domain-containing protein [Bryobacteraceae bacterium]HXJ44680.1 NAD(P)-binding domain-containing protein [Bryobacteraceae bacterium]
MRVGILGTGDVGRALGRAFAQLGHQVKMGSREPKNEKATAWAVETGPAASTGTFAESAQFAEVAVLCTLWSGTENALRLAGPQNLAGKVLIDATNPLVFSPGAPPALALGHTDSGGEQVQRWAPQARVVKAFNTVGNAHMFKPQFPGGPPDMFICGNDAAAKTTVTDILTAFGWNTVDMGGIEGARLLEPMCVLWVLYGMRTNTWNHAFKLLRR